MAARGHPHRSRTAHGGLGTAPAPPLLLLLANAAAAWQERGNATLGGNATQVDFERAFGCAEGTVEPHLHLNRFYDSADVFVGELNDAGVDLGIILSVYPTSMALPPEDPNAAVLRLANASSRLYGMASLNTSDWDDGGAYQLANLAQYLQQPRIVGAKLAPPHTCLALNDTKMAEIIKTVSASPAPVLFIHIGTTPFCPEGRLGGAIMACCGDAFVNASYLEPAVEAHPEVKFVLVHAGFDFALADVTVKGEARMAYVDSALALAATHENVYLELSAIFASHRNGTLKYAGGDAVVERARRFASRTMWGADANHGEPHQNDIGRNLEHLERALVDSGYNNTEACSVLGGTARRVFAGIVGDGV